MWREQEEEVFWRQVGSWELARPLIPVYTVDGKLRWLKKCWRRRLQSYWPDGPTIYQWCSEQF